MKIRKLPGVVLAISVLHLFAIFTAPYTIPAGTVTDYNGRANIIDFYDDWAELNPYARIVYTLGDLNCHQIDSRSLYLNGNQMPVCARCTGLALGFVFGAVLFLIMIPDPDPIRMALSSVAGKKALGMSKNKLIITSTILGILLMGPMVIDGLTQATFNYESTNIIRFFTGMSFGLGFVVCLGSFLESFVYRSLYIDRI